MPRSTKAVVTLGPVVAPVVRTTGQVVTGAFIIEGVELFLWVPTASQTKWLTALASVAVAGAQNWWEKRQGRKLVGTSP